MFGKRELLNAIKECESNPTDYAGCAKLATFYTLYDHLYPAESTEQTVEEYVDKFGDTEFFTVLDGCKADKAWQIMAELMDTMEVMHPEVYRAILKKLSQVK